MASITYDGQSFMLDGRRLWLVCGSLPYTRIPRALWAERVAQAKHAGLNAIEIPIVWARHESRQGQFDFQNDNDIRHLVQLIQKAGMYVFLRAGPFIGSGYDMGGLPPWLLSLNQANGGIKLRTNQAPFLEACSRFINALAGQLRDLQVTSPTKGGATAGPILLMQTETQWTCGDDTLADTYLLEIDRYFREAGFSIPLINSNDLWQSVEGEIDGWTGFDGLLANLRQLGSIRPNSPRIVTQFQIGRTRSWGKPAEPARTPGEVLARLTEVLAAGGQFNIDPFFGGTNLGFSAGRDPADAEAFLCTSNDAGAPVSETGQARAVYHAVRRVCTFASRFNRLLSHLDPARQGVTMLPGHNTADGKSEHAKPSVVHINGTQGSIAFIFAGKNEPEKADKAGLTLLLPDGSTLPVELGELSAAWCLLDTRITQRGHLDYTNLSAFAIVGKVFICFGPEGSRGVVSINGSPLEITVPSGLGSPHIAEHEGVTVVIANPRQIESIAVDDTGVYLGIDGFDPAGQPVMHGDSRQYTRIDLEGQSKVIKPVANPNAPGIHAAAKHQAKGKVTLGEWASAGIFDYADGTSARYASITKPADLVSVGAPYGYGWYRLKFPSSSVHKPRVMFPQSGHRLHLILDGEPAGLVGAGPGAGPSIGLNLKKKSHTLVALAENLGRAAGGTDLGEPTGLWGHAWCVEHVGAGRPKLVASEPVDILKFRAPLWKIHRDDMSDPMRATWALQHRRKTPIIMTIAPFESSSNGGIVLLDNTPIAYFSPGSSKVIILDAEQLGRGKAEIQITMVGSTEDDMPAIAKAVSFEEGVDMLTAKAEWAFAKWDVPGPEAFGKKIPAGAAHGVPMWYRSTLHVDEGDAPVFFEATGLSKGQIYLNGKHIGRYFIATSAGKKVPPQTRYLLPRALLKNGQDNDLMIFDEHGFSPSKSRVVADASLTAVSE